MIRERDAVLLVEVGDHRRVAGPANVVAASCELVAELQEVVDLAVEDGHDVAGLVRDGLAPGDEVDDPKTAVAEHAALEGVDRALVRPAVDERVVHRGDDGGVRFARQC